MSPAAGSRAMRILDKYLLRELLLPVAYCFDGFAMLWVVMDLFGRLDDFIEVHARLAQAVKFYLLLFPDVFVQIVPMSLLLGLLFGLANLGKHNELIAMRASGISMPRLALPLLSIGLLASLLIFGLNQKWVPRSREHADNFLRNLKGKRSKTEYINFFLTDPIQRRAWYAGRFEIAAGEMTDVEIHEEKPDGSPLRDLYAEKARWADGAWHFTDVEVHDYTQTPVAVSRVAETSLPAIRASPRDLALEVRELDQMTSAELRRYIRALHRSGRSGRLADYQVALQDRYAFPWTCWTVMWIGIPLGLQVSRRGPLLSVGLALVLVVTFYFLSHIALALGRAGHLTPLWAAWLTPGIFAVVGAYLFYRVR